MFNDKSILVTGGTGSLKNIRKVVTWCTGCSLLAFAAVALTAGPTRADSELSLPYPVVFGKIPAATFDASQRRVGDADLQVEKLDGGMVRLYSESTADGGARAIATAVLAPTGDGTALRPITQESRAFDLEGRPRRCAARVAGSLRTRSPSAAVRRSTTSLTT